MRRPTITALNGQHYAGRIPQQLGTTGEAPYIAELARTVNGLCEVVLPVGRADAASATAVFEVEPARSWRFGVRQVLGYAGQTGWAQRARAAHPGLDDCSLAEVAEDLRRQHYSEAAARARAARIGVRAA